jgi:predicted RNA-binding protein with PUA-like domain
LKYWLLKTEPGTYSWDDLKKKPNQTDIWEGIRNYQARNLLREMKKGDLVFFYHSGSTSKTIMGIVKIVKEAYPDYTQFESESKYYDPKSSTTNQRWDMVDVQFHRNITPPITLDELRQKSGLEKMMLLKKGSRLSVQPVSESEWQIILSLRS